MSNTNQVDWLPNQGWDSRIHIAANGELVNVFVIITERYVIIVDTLLNPTTANVLAEFAQAHLSSRQLFVINTHSDWDHAWGNQLFAGSSARYPAPIIAHTESATRFEHPDTLELLQEVQAREPAIFRDVRLTKPTLTFSQALHIDGGDLTLRLFPTPGHTSDHISIYIPEIDTLLAGDAAEFPFPFAENATTLPTLRASLAAMASLDAANLLYCHAPTTIGPQLIHDNIAYFDALEVACRAALARGIDAAKLPDSELAETLDCDFASTVPTTDVWTNVSDDVRTESHTEQLRLMLEWLAQSESQHLEK